MISEQIPEQFQQSLAQLQVYQQQLQNILLQKEGLNLQLAEMDAASKELQKTKEAELYKISGPILIKTNKTEMEKELKDKTETVTLRVKTLDKSENLIRTKITEIRNKLSKIEKP